MRALRRQLAATIPDAAERVAAALPSGWLPDEIDSYALYHPVGSEIDPSRIRLPTGHRALPVAVGVDEPLVFRRHEPGDLLVPDALGVPAPAPGSPRVWPDIVFAPVLAFDQRGGRLGQGGGHYDRTIEALRARKATFVVGVAFSGQEVSEIPLEAHDQRLDAILTENGYIELQRDRDH